MANPTETTLVSLFPTQEHATKALNDLRTAGIPQEWIQVLGQEASDTSAPEQSLTTLQGLNLPDKDVQVLANGLKSGGRVIVVRAYENVGKAEAIFERHETSQIDERDFNTDAKAVAAVEGEGVIPVMEEELQVGKRTVQTGGVRVFSRIVETPVQEQVTLREERATIERHAVNRPISGAELSSLQSQTIEVKEMAEEAVVEKTARVVEEIHIGKEATERTQQIKDTVRKTEVEVDQIPGKTVKDTQRKSHVEDLIKQ